MTVMSLSDKLQFVASWVWHRLQSVIRRIKSQTEVCAT
jgi:hypothetical protein